LGAMFAMHSHLSGKVMDIKPDQKSGRKTMAVVLERIPCGSVSCKNSAQFNFDVGLAPKLTPTCATAYYPGTLQGHSSSATHTS